MFRIYTIKQIYTFLYIPFFILIILLSPILLIRFGKLDSSRIGHFATNTTLNILEKKRNNFKSIDIFYLDKVTSNTFLLKLWKRNIIVLPRILVFPFFNFFYNYFFLKTFIAKDNKNSDRDINRLIEKNEVLLKFTNTELKKGENILKNMGIKNSDKIVLIYNRDTKYLNKNYSFDSSYHNFRNSDIGNYIYTAEELTKKNFFVLRIGRNVEKKLASNNKKIIDYADSKYQDDFMDIYLHYTCEFIISNGAGIDEISRLFRKPILKVNFCPYIYIPTYQLRTSILPKKHYDKKNKKFLSLNELFELNIAQAYNTKDFVEKNIELIENSPEEIKCATFEFINSVIDNSKEDQKIQRKFWRVYYQNLSKYGLENLHCSQDQKIALISNIFLNENHYLLN